MNLSWPNKTTTLLPSGDHAILAVFKVLKQQGYTTIIIQDQGGWLTYPDYAKKAGLEIIELSTDYGLIDPASIPAVKNAALIVNSLTGYFAEQNMGAIAQKCKELHILLINDVSGSIAASLDQFGDIILGSFGTGKPVDVGYGGFVAARDFEFQEEFDEKYRKELETKLAALPQRQAYLRTIAKNIKNDLKDYNIIHRSHNGINVIVKWTKESEKQAILDYCKKNNYPVTFCPRYIRVKAQAISIEVKRLTSSS